MMYAHRVLVRVGKSGAVAHRLGVKHRDVRVHTLRNASPLVLPNLIGRQRRHLADRFFQRKHVEVSNVMCQHARERGTNENTNGLIGWSGPEIDTIKVTSLHASHYEIDQQRNRHNTEDDHYLLRRPIQYSRCGSRDRVGRRKEVAAGRNQERVNQIEGANYWLEEPSRFRTHQRNPYQPSITDTVLGRGLLYANGFLLGGLGKHQLECCGSGGKRTSMRSYANRRCGWTAS